MRKLLYTLVFLLSLNFYGQSRSDIINVFVQTVEEDIGVRMPKTIAGGGLIGMKAINENNNTIIYQYRCSNKQVADYYKANGTKSLLIGASPNSFSKRAKSSEIIAKWRYYYNNEIILELTVYPNEWND